MTAATHTIDILADDVPRACLAVLLKHFSAVDDEREPWRVVYPLAEMLLLLTCATIASCDADYFGSAPTEELAGKTTVEKGHGRTETRAYKIFSMSTGSSPSGAIRARCASPISRRCPRSTRAPSMPIAARSRRAFTSRPPRSISTGSPTAPRPPGRGKYALAARGRI
jgi:hypothetical protein